MGPAQLYASEDFLGLSEFHVCAMPIVKVLYNEKMFLSKQVEMEWFWRQQLRRQYIV